MVVVAVAIMVAVTVVVVVVLAVLVVGYLVSDMKIFHVPDPLVVLTIVLVMQDADPIVVTIIAVAIVAVTRGDHRCGKQRLRHEQRCQEQRKTLHHLYWTPFPKLEMYSFSTIVLSNSLLCSVSTHTPCFQMLQGCPHPGVKWEKTLG